MQIIDCRSMDRVGLTVWGKRMGGVPVVYSRKVNKALIFPLPSLTLDPI